MSEVEKHYGIGDDPGHSATAEQGPAAKAAKAAARAKGAVGDTVDQAATWSRERYGAAQDWAEDTYRDASRRAVNARRRTVVHATRGWRTVEDFVEENPVMVGVAGLAAGLLIGALLPGTRRENRYFGAYADDVRDQGLRYAQDLAEQGRHVMEDKLDRLHRERDGDRVAPDA